MSKKYRKNRHNTTAVRTLVRPITPYLVAFVAFLLICLCAASSMKGTAVFIVLAAIATCFIRFKKLREQVRLPLIVLALVVLMDFISTFYAVSGKFALSEFLKVIVSFAMVLLLLALTPGEGVQPGRRIAAILSRCATFMGLVSIDLISTRWISNTVVSFLSIFSSDYFSATGVENGIRMTSLLQNPNVFAGIAGIGVLLSLSLALSTEQGKERKSHIVCLFINALAFVLAFSMGATGVIIAAFLVYLILETKERRAGLFILMAETLVVTMIGVVWVSMTSLQTWSGFQPVPLLCVIVGAAVLCLLDHFVGQRLAEKLAGHGKTLLIIIVGLLVVLLVGVVAAYNLTGGTDLGAGESLRRSVYPETGDYVVTAQTTGPVLVTIESQNQQETMMHTSTVLYQGYLSEASFAVPDDSLVVYFNFSSEQDVQMEAVSFSGQNGDGMVPLGYKLLPNFIANRIQGLFANQNAIQRTVFFEDGLKLFGQSPIFGLGLGSYESGITSVQSFYYETKYAHNHYVQALTETGIIGLLLFVGLLVVSAVAILRSRRKEKVHFLVPALGAALVFMAGHAAVEVIFSFYAYLPMAFGIFALINLCCRDAVQLPLLNGKVKTGILSGFIAILAVFFILLCGNMRSAALVQSTPTFDSLEKAVKADKYEWADYMLSYINNVDNAADVPEIQTKAEEYALRLAELDSNTLPVYLAEFYFKRGNVEQGLAMVEKYVNYVSSDPEAWQRAFLVLQVHAQETDEFRAGVAKILGLLDAWNEQNMGQITLTETNLEFLEFMGF